MSKKNLILATAFFSASSAMAADAPALFAPLEQLAAEAPAIIVNKDDILGGGVIVCGILENQGSITLRDLPSIIKAKVINTGKMEVAYEQAVFIDDFTNSGIMKTTDTMVRFDGLYQEFGSYISDPSDNYFMDLYIGETGILIGGVGDNFYIRGDLISSSTQNESWFTTDSLLGFRDGYDLDHDFSITGADIGAVTSGYINNFAWGILEIAANNSLRLLDGNLASGGALYVGEITGLTVSANIIDNLSSPDDINIYYRQELPGNSYLGGQVYDYSGGQLIPIWPKSPDIDHDGDVDGMDLVLLAADMNTTCQPGDACYTDINDDGQVDGDDLQIFAPAFGNPVD